MTGISNPMIIVGTSQGIHSLDPTTGAENWFFNPGFDSVRSPIVANDRVYFTSDDTLYALEVATGNKIWEFNTNSTSYLSPPTIANEFIHMIGTGDGVELYGIDISEGSPSLEWKEKQAFGFSAMEEPAWYGGNIHYGFQDSFDDADYNAKSFDARTGERNWSTRMSQVIDMTAIQAKEEVVISASNSLDFTTEGGIQAYAIEDGDPLWIFNPGGMNVNSTPIIRDGSVYVGQETNYLQDNDGNYILNSEFSNDPQGLYMYNVDKEDGSQQWNNTTERLSGHVYEGTVDDTGQRYVHGSHTGILHAYDTDSGDTEWEKRIYQNDPNDPQEPGFSTAVTSAGANGYIGAGNGEVVAFDMRTGEVNWKKNLTPSYNDGNRPVTGAPTYVDPDVGGEAWSAGTRIFDQSENHHTELQAFNRITEFQARGKIGTVQVLVQYDAPFDGNFAEAKLKIKNVDKDNIIYEDRDARKYRPKRNRAYIVTEVAPVAKFLGGDEIEITLDIQKVDGNGEFIVSANNTLETRHQHPEIPGIINLFNGDFEYPENVQIGVNGELIDEEITGGGPFEANVDVSGLLKEGQVNTIEISSQELGHIQAFIEGDVYRQIAGGG